MVSTVYVNNLLDTANAGLARLTDKLVANTSNQARFTIKKTTITERMLTPQPEQIHHVEIKYYNFAISLAILHVTWRLIKPTAIS